MPFSQRNILLVYNSSDVASEELATSYATLKSIENANIFSVATDTDASYSTLAEYTTELEDPVKAKIIQLRNAGTPISCVVLSFRIPILVVAGANTKSTSSLLSSCLLATRTAGTANDFYLSMNEELIAAGECDLLSVMHLDAATLLTARQRMNSFASLSSTIDTDGYVYFDPTDRYNGSNLAQQWIDSVSLAADTCPFPKVVASIEVGDASSVFSRIVDGSIVISSGVQHAGTGYFKDTSRAKIFYFNADDDGFSEPRTTESQKPAIRAVEFGYTVVAGMVDDPPVIDPTTQYPDPRAILYAASNGIPMACAMIWSQKAVGEHLAVYGDPLAKFRAAEAEEEKFDAIEGYMSAINNIAQARAQIRTRELYASRILRIVSAADSADFKRKFLLKSKSLSFIEDGISLGILSSPSSELRNISKHVGYARYDFITEPSFEELIRLFGKKIPLSFLRANVDSNLILTRIGSGLIQPQGIAVIEFRIPTISGLPRFFHLRAQGYDAEENLIFDVDSINRSDLWRYESEPGVMTRIPPEGIYTSLAGRYIEFTQPTGSSPSLVEVRGEFSIIEPGEEPILIHEAYWRTQE
jgi:hypothetical protein